MRSVLNIMTLICALIAVPVQALNWESTLKDSAMSRFSDEDFKYLDEASEKALEYSEDGEKVIWSNPETGASGTITTLRTKRVNDSQCRRLYIVNQAGGFTGEFRFWFCKLPDGSWKIASPSDIQGR